MSTLPRGVCPVCGQERQLTKAGVMRDHLGDIRVGGWRQQCRGVGEPPRVVVADPVAAALDLGRAAGWREAIEALREEAARVWEGRPVEARDLRHSADFLESLAPKETP